MKWVASNHVGDERAASAPPNLPWNSPDESQ